MPGEEPPGPDVWVHPAVEVRPSPIAGHGLFATTAIDAGVVVVRLGGRLVDTAELHRLIDQAGDDGYVDTTAVGPDTHVVLPTGTVAHYGNHSCNPTLWPVSTYELATRAPVTARAELTIDYALISDDEPFLFDCTCGAATCRSVLRGDDWRRPDLQQRYAGHWPPGLQQRIDAATS